MSVTPRTKSTARRNAEHFRLAPSLISSMRPNRAEFLATTHENTLTARGAVRYPDASLFSDPSTLDYTGDLSRYFATPPSAVSALLYYWGAYLRGKTIWDPCAGGGNMSELIGDALDMNVTSTDVADEFGYSKSAGYDPIDFLAYTFAPNARMPDAIIMDPPGKLFAEFAEKAIKLLTMRGDSPRDAPYFIASRAPLSALAGVGNYDRVYRYAPPLQIIVMAHRPAVMSYADIKKRVDADAKGVRIPPYVRSKENDMWCIWTNLVNPSRVVPVVHSLARDTNAETPPMEKLYER